MNNIPRNENENNPVNHEWEQPDMGTAKGQPGIIQLKKNLEIEKLKEELMEKMQEQIKAIHGPNLYGSVSIDELCLAVEVLIPKDFKIPDFSKYDGSSNPLFHLKTYCTKMGIWSRDERFLTISFT